MNTRSLTLATNPAARLKELHDLDNPASVSAIPDSQQPVHPSAQQPGNPAIDELMYAATNESVNPGAGEPASERAHEEASAPSKAATKQSVSTPTHRAPRSEVPKSALSNPVLDAMRQDLLEPYPADSEDTYYRASTVRLPAVLWERLDTASTLLKKTRHPFHDKQDIVAEALKFYLTKIGKEQV